MFLEMLYEVKSVKQNINVCKTIVSVENILPS